jgi:hypothetical protein
MAHRLYTYLCGFLFLYAHANAEPSNEFWNPFQLLFNDISTTRLQSSFEQQPLVNSRSAQQASTILKLLADQDGWIQDLTNTSKNASSFVQSQHTQAITWRNASGDTVAMPRNDSVVAQRLASGHSVVVKRELTPDEDSPLQQALQKQFLTEVSAHAYISGGAAQALKVRSYLWACSSATYKFWPPFAATHGPLRCHRGANNGSKELDSVRASR